ncbi:MAG: hypothetical protein H0V70_19420 [Ktedonobacteraceae bacterium]|nr:hypothetical protein [Ktedonobacteraceae bacterium]
MLQMYLHLHEARFLHHHRALLQPVPQIPNGMGNEAGPGKYRWSGFRL